MGVLCPYASLRTEVRMEAKEGYSTLFQNMNTDLLAGVAYSASNKLRCLKWRFVISGFFERFIVYNSFREKMTSMLCYLVGVIFMCVFSVWYKSFTDIGFAGPNRSCFYYLAHVIVVCTLVSIWVYYTHCLCFKLLNCDLEPEGHFKESLINGYCYSRGYAQTCSFFLSSAHFNTLSPFSRPHYKSFGT